MSPAATVTAHIRAHAPAMTGGIIDYPRLLGGDLPMLDLYDSRAHRGSVAGSDLADRVAVRAGALAARGLGRGDRVVMVATNDVEYLATLLAVLLLGAVPCAVAPPPTPSRPESAGVQHLRAAIRVLDPAMVLCSDRTVPAAEHPGAVAIEDLVGAQVFPMPHDRPAPQPDDIHHVQLTSGSTSDPKAVVLTHRNVVDNLGVLAHAMRVERGRDRMFSWLPTYHDMGLIQVLGALLYGLPLGWMTPLGFLRDPLSWVRHMSSHRSTVTAAPTFAYRSAAEALARAADADGIDLSAVRHAFVGAEPIPASVLGLFADGFAPLGFRPDALVPCYGMAESVLATTLAFGGVRTRAVDGEHAPMVSCGPPVDGMRIAVVDPDGVEVPAGVVGDIRIAGPSVFAGYRHPDGTIARPRGGWHDTGDRGLLWDGELFVVGRSKEMLIVRGRNLPPYDVERVIGEIPGVGYGQSVVCAVRDDRNGAERIVAVVATARTDTGTRGGLPAEVRTRVREVFGFTLDDVVLVGKSAIPRTTSGKIQRLRVSQFVKTGECEPIARQNVGIRA